MIRVLHVIPSLSPAQGGPSVMLPIMERALAALGVKVETATTDDNGPGERLRCRLGTALEENGVARWYFPKQSEFYKLSWPFGQWLTNEVKRFDLLHIHSAFNFVSVKAARIARRQHVPYILRPLGLLNRYGMTQRRPLLKWLSWNCLERPLFRDAAAVHFTSLAEQTEAEQLGVPLRSVVIPLGIDPPSPEQHGLFATSFPDLCDKKVVLYLSRIDPKKNVEALLQAIASLSADFPDLMFIVAGGGAPEYLHQLKRLCEDLDIAAKVRWPGHVSGDLKTALLNNATTFALPSFSENFGIAVLEAMFAGRACLVSSGVALSHDMKEADAGLVVAPDPQSIASGLRHLLSDERERQRIGTNARQLAEHQFSSTVMATRLLELYSRIINRSAIRPRVLT